MCLSRMSPVDIKSNSMSPTVIAAARDGTQQHMSFLRCEMQCQDVYMTSDLEE